MDKKSFFDLLLAGDMVKVRDKLIVKGKNPKPICPIFFFKDKEEDNDSNNDKGKV